MKIQLKENVLQALLIALNFIFALLSVSLIGLGIVYIDDLTLIQVYVTRISFLKLPKLLIILGALSFLSSIAGCYFIRNYNQKYLRIYIAFLTMLLAAELTIGCLAFMNIEDTRVEKTTVQMTQLLNTTEKTRNEFYIIEEHFRCCGILSVDDYKCDDLVLINETLCWKIFERHSRMPVSGCAHIVVSNLKRISFEIGTYMSVYAIFQIIDITCLLMIYMKSENLK